MFPQPKSKPEFHPDDSDHAIAALQQHLRAGFAPDLALDLVLNGIVVQAAQATHADAAALALTRRDELVCRAATGQLAPDLGVRLNSRDGLSGACVETHQPQLSADTEFDPRVDPVVARRLGIRSILIVPVFDANDRSKFEGILEAFSSAPSAFSYAEQKTLEGFALECARTREASVELARRDAKVPPAQIGAPELIRAEVIARPISENPAAAAPLPIPPVRKPRYEAWALALGGLTIAAAIAVSFLVGSRVGWLRRGTGAQPGLEAVHDGPAAVPSEEAAAPRRDSSKSASGSKTAPASKDELVVYEKGKIVFRMKPAPGAGSHESDSATVVPASTSARLPLGQSVWIAPAQAEARLIARVEPTYPEEALSARRSGEVVLEVQVAEDGAVSGVRTISGDPLLARAATEAVRSWRYQPYRQHDQPTQFQTDVTLTFSLPD